MISKLSLFLRKGPSPPYRGPADTEANNCGDSLSLRENADQRPTRRRFRAEIAHETILCPNLDVAWRATAAIDQHRAHRRFIGIRHRKFFETVIVHELLSGLLRQRRLGTRLHDARSNERFFHKTPAKTMRVRASAFLGNRGRPA